MCTRCCKLLPELRRNWSQTGRKCSQRWFIIDAMFEGLCKYFIQVYDEMPTDLQNQMANMEKHVAMYKDQYPLKVVLLKQGCLLLLKNPLSYTILWKSSLQKPFFSSIIHQSNPFQKYITCWACLSFCLCLCLCDFRR